MAAITGQQFLSLLEQMLVRANMPEAALAYYSFYPLSGQSEFLFNNLSVTGEAFLQKVKEVQISNQGSGYLSGETPAVTFSSRDAGAFASGTAVMASFTDFAQSLSNGLIRAYTFDNSGMTNLIVNGTFASGQTGWYGSTGQLPESGSEIAFSGGRLYIDPTLLASIRPNYDSLHLTGPLWFQGSYDIVSGGSTGSIFGLFTTLSGSGTLPSCLERTDYVEQRNSFSGKHFFGGFIPTGAGFKPAFGAALSELNVVDNITLYTGNLLAMDRIQQNAAEACVLYPDNQGKVLAFYSGISGAALGQTRVGTKATTQPSGVFSMLTAVDNYSLSFWHNFVKEVSDTVWYPNFAELAEWPHFKLRVVNGYYSLYCTDTNTSIDTNIPFQYGTDKSYTGNWHNIQISVIPKLISISAYPPV